MITFQMLIDEARRQKNILALDFYNLLKKIQVEHDNYRFDLVSIRECPLETKYFWLWNLVYQICSKAVEEESSINSRRF